MPRASRTIAHRGRQPRERPLRYCPAPAPGGTVMSHFPDAISYAIQGGHGARRPETDDEMAARIAYEESALAKWDQPAADARVAVLERFLALAEEAGFAYGGSEGDDGISEAREELRRLQAGPPTVRRERGERWAAGETYLERQFAEGMRDASAGKYAAP